MIRFGTNPIACLNDDDRALGTEIPLVQCLREAGEISAEGVEEDQSLPLNSRYLSGVLTPNYLAHVSACYSMDHPARPVDAEKRTIRPHLHASCVGQRRARNVRTSVFMVPGDPDGIANFPACLSTLTVAHYEGSLVTKAEQDSAVRNPKRSQTIGFDPPRKMAIEAEPSIAA